MYKIGPETLKNEVILVIKSFCKWLGLSENVDFILLLPLSLAQFKTLISLSVAYCYSSRNIKIK